MAARQISKLSVYYDSLCPVCDHEINFYKKKKGAERIRFVDIASPEFNARAEGLDPKSVQKEFHVKNQAGKLFTGVDAFVEIWKELGIFGRMEKVLNQKALRPIVDLGYRGFAYIRPWLRKEAPQCEGNVCRTKIP